MATKNDDEIGRVRARTGERRIGSGHEGPGTPVLEARDIIAETGAAVRASWTVVLPIALLFALPNAWFNVAFARLSSGDLRPETLGAAALAYGVVIVAGLLVYLVLTQLALDACREREPSLSAALRRSRERLGAGVGSSGVLLGACVAILGVAAGLGYALLHISEHAALLLCMGMASGLLLLMLHYLPLLALLVPTLMDQDLGAMDTVREAQRMGVPYRWDIFNATIKASLAFALVTCLPLVLVTLALGVTVARAPDDMLLVSNLSAALMSGLFTVPSVMAFAVMYEHIRVCPTPPPRARTSPPGGVRGPAS